MKHAPEVRARIIEFIAAGGTGKTKLLRHWLDRNEERVPNRIIWSFYSQGTTEARQVSSSPLFDEGFKTFTVDQTQFTTEEAKADAFAELLIQHHCLLVLDGPRFLEIIARRPDLSFQVIAALSMATSVPVPIAMPTSAAASAGASLTPSPVTATTSCWASRSLTMRSLSSGVVRANTARSASAVRSAASSMSSRSVPVPQTSAFHASAHSV